MDGQPKHTEGIPILLTFRYSTVVLDLVWVGGVFAIPGKSCVGDRTGLRWTNSNYFVHDDFWGIKAVVKEAPLEFFG